MKHIVSNRFERVRAALLGAAVLGILHSAVACGRVRTDDSGSETHWLARCDTDLDCAQGSCECGVCSRPCEAVGDCAELGLGGVQCTRAALACGGETVGQSEAAANYGACLISCALDSDCAELGGDAVCLAQRCERSNPAVVVADGAGGQGGESGGTAGDGSIAGQGGSSDQSPESAALCDGSEDVRLAHVVAGGFQGPVERFYLDVYGYRSFVIDGQCRFWYTQAGNGWVYTGVLDPVRAQEFAAAIGYGRLDDHSAFEDPPCPDGSISTLAAPEGRIRCGCQCATNPDAPEGWREAFRAISARRDALFASGETVTGPARMVLLTPSTMGPDYEPVGWPLGRAPSPSETLANDGSVSLTASSGALIEDPVELAALRDLRDVLAAERFSGFGESFIPVAYFAPQPFETYDLFLRDEVPEKVRAALVNAAR